MTQAQVLALTGAGLAVYLASRKPAAGAPGAGVHTLPPNVPELVSRWRDDAVDAGRVYGVSPQLVLAVIWKESSGVPTAEGSAGEVGLMQVKDVAAADVGFLSVPYEPRANIYVGTAYLALQIKRMGDVYNGLRAYQQGEAGARSSPFKGASYARDVLKKAGWS